MLPPPGTSYTRSGGAPASTSSTPNSRSTGADSKSGGTVWSGVCRQVSVAIRVALVRARSNRNTARITSSSTSSWRRPPKRAVSGCVMLNLSTMRRARSRRSKLRVSGAVMRSRCDRFRRRKRGGRSARRGPCICCSLAAVEAQMPQKIPPLQGQAFWGTIVTRDVACSGR